MCMRKILGAVLIAAVLTGGSGLVSVDMSASAEPASEADSAGTSGGSGAAAVDSPEEQPVSMIGKTDFSEALDSGEERVEAFEDCFTDSDIPKPETFFSLTAQGIVDSWAETGEASYAFSSPADGEAEGGMVSENSQVDAAACIEKTNEYLTGRGYGREACFLDPENGGTDIIWYKGSCQVKITMLAPDNFIFTALTGAAYIYEPEMLLGKWEGYAERQGENYIMTLDFKEDGQVEYMAGWVQSEAAFLSTGTYIVDTGRLHLSFPYDQVSGQQVNWKCTYRFEALNDNLRMEYISGDSLNIFQEAGAIFNYSRPADADSGESAPADSAEFVLTEEDKKILREHLRVPETAVVEFQIGEEYFWEAAEAEVVPISIYENGVYVAGADISKETKELMTSILTYQN